MRISGAVLEELVPLPVTPLELLGGKKMKSDDAVITRIREARHQISEEHCQNPRKLVAYYIQLQKQHKERLLESPQIEDEGRFSLKT